jgi:hypothetical protein
MRRTTQVCNPFISSRIIHSIVYLIKRNHICTVYKHGLTISFFFFCSRHCFPSSSLYDRNNVRWLFMSNCVIALLWNIEYDIKKIPCILQRQELFIISFIFRSFQNGKISFFRHVCQWSGIFRCYPGRSLRTPFTVINGCLRCRIRPYTCYLRFVYDRISPYYMIQYYDWISPWPYTEKYGGRIRSVYARERPYFFRIRS